MNKKKKIYKHKGMNKMGGNCSNTKYVFTPVLFYFIFATNRNYKFNDIYVFNVSHNFKRQMLASKLYGMIID